MGDWKVDPACKYTTTDEWIRVEGGEAQIGISDYAQDKLSDIVFVELPAVGKTFGKGDTFGVVESVKAAADLKMPVAGEVIAANNALEDAPETLNQDPFGGGWIVRVKVSNPGELDSLMDATAYAAYCDERG